MAVGHDEVVEVHMDPIPGQQPVFRNRQGSMSDLPIYQPPPPQPTYTPGGGQNLVDRLLGSIHSDSTKEKFWGQAKWRDGMLFDDNSARYWGESAVYGTVYEKYQVRHGTGMCMWNTGDIYLGQHNRDLREGKGVCLYRDGMMYDGEWHEGLREGSGRCVYPSGSVYFGEWKNDIREGHGVFEWPDGTVYMGTWQHDRRHGFGVISFPDKDEFYEGQIQSNMKHGYGRYVFGPTLSFTGQFERDSIKGAGVFFNNGSRYEGHFVNGGSLFRRDYLQLSDHEKEQVISSDLLARSKTVMGKSIERAITRSIKGTSPPPPAGKRAGPGGAAKSPAPAPGGRGSIMAMRSLGGSMESVLSGISATPRLGPRPVGLPPMTLPKLNIHHPRGNHDDFGVKAVRSGSWFEMPAGAVHNDAVCFRILFDEDWLKVKDRSVTYERSSQTLTKYRLPKGRTPSPDLMFPPTLNRQPKAHSAFQMRVEVVHTMPTSVMEPTDRELPPIIERKQIGGGDRISETKTAAHKFSNQLLDVDAARASISGGISHSNFARKALDHCKTTSEAVLTYIIHSGLVNEMKFDTNPTYISETLVKAATEKSEALLNGPAKTRSSISMMPSNTVSAVPSGLPTGREYAR